MRGQALVEVALITPVLLLIILGGAQVGIGILHQMRLEHAVIEGVVAGASEPDVPRRCDVARQTTAQVFGRPPTRIQCTEPGNLITLEAHDDLVLIVPLWSPTWSIGATESALVRK